MANAIPAKDIFLTDIIG